jgi:hypothetical protein
MPSRRLVAAGLTACVLLLPAAAHAAPTLQPLARCYVSAAPDQRESMAVAAAGFTPNAVVELAIDGTPVRGTSPVQADPSGEFRGDVQVPYRRRGERAFTVTLTEVGNAANTVSARSRVTALMVDVTPQQAEPTRRVRFRGRGFTRRGPVFAHYVHRGRVMRTVRMGRPRGRCGTFTARRRQIPVQPRRGIWTVQFDQLRRFTDPPESVFVQLRIRVFPTAR